MKHTLSQVCADKAVRKALAEGHCHLSDGNDVFSQLNFAEMSMRLNHRAVFDTIAAQGGEEALAAVLQAGTTNLTRDPNAANVGMVAVRGVEGYYIKTNASALAAFTSILNALLAYGNFAEDFDLDLVTLSTEKEADEEDQVENVTEQTAEVEEGEDEEDEDDDDEEGPDLEALFFSWQKQQSDQPCPISFVSKGGVHCFYSDTEEKFITLNLPESWEEGAPTKPLGGVAEYEVLAWKGFGAHAPTLEKPKETDLWSAPKEAVPTDAELRERFFDAFEPDEPIFEPLNEWEQPFEWEEDEEEEIDPAPPEVTDDEADTEEEVVHFTFGYKFRLEGQSTWGFISADFQQVTPANFLDFRITPDGDLLGECHTPNEEYEDWDAADFYYYNFKEGGLRLLYHVELMDKVEESVLPYCSLRIDSPYRDYCLDGDTDDVWGREEAMIYRLGQNTLFGSLPLYHYRNATTGQCYDFTFTAPRVTFWVPGPWGEKRFFFACQCDSVDDLELSLFAQLAHEKGFPMANSVGGFCQHLPSLPEYGHLYFTRLTNTGAQVLCSVSVDSYNGLANDESSERTLIADPCDSIQPLTAKSDEPRFLVSQQGKVGLYDLTAGFHSLSAQYFLLPCDFTSIAPFTTHWMDKELLVNRFGKLGLFVEGEGFRLPCGYTAIEAVPCGPDDYVYRVTRYGKEGICLRGGTQIIPCDFDSIAVKDGRYEVTKMDFTGTLDRAGKWVTPLHREE